MHGCLLGLDHLQHHGAGEELKQRLPCGDTAVATVSVMNKNFGDSCVLLWHDDLSLLLPLARDKTCVAAVAFTMTLPVAVVSRSAGARWVVGR